ncbi:hypothetical protein HDE_01618 [Halotydeus destructor]|nr:hypothetical protein HDE_01618 [Halotydeus destructor]
MDLSTTLYYDVEDIDCELVVLDGDKPDFEEENSLAVKQRVSRCGSSSGYETDSRDQDRCSPDVHNRTSAVTVLESVADHTATSETCNLRQKELNQKLSESCESPSTSPADSLTAGSETGRVPRKKHQLSREHLCANHASCGQWVYNSSRDLSIAPFCLQCSFWIHVHDYKERFGNFVTGSDKCIFCVQLKNCTGKTNLSYKNEELLAYDPLEVKMSLMAYMKVVPQVPKTKPSRWKFFFNYERNKNDIDTNFNVKLGDVVYVAQVTEEEKSRARLILQSQRKDYYVPKTKCNQYAYAIRVQYIIEEDGIAYISGYNYFNAEQVKQRQLEMEQKLSKPKRKVDIKIQDCFLKSITKQPKQLILVNDYNTWAPLNSITGNLSVLLKADFEAGKARGYSKDATFLCCWQYSYHSNSLQEYVRDLYHNRCKNDVVFQLKEETAPKRAKKDAD